MLESQHDIAIIGGGVIGLMTARELQLTGADVVVLEAQQCGREASWAGGGIVSPLYPWRYSPPITALADWSQQQYQSISESLWQQTGIDPEWQQSGLLLLSVDDAEQALAWSVAHGNRIQIVDAQTLSELQPDLPAQQQALWVPAIAQVRNPRLMKALRRYAELNAIAVHEHCAIQSMQSDASGDWFLRSESRLIRARHVVICAGAWSRQLLQSMPEAPAIEPVRGQMIMFAPTEHRLQRIVLQDGRYLIPRRDGRILCGSTLEYVGFDKSTTSEAFESLLESAFRIMPSLRQHRIEKHWAGLRPGIADNVPRIGEMQKGQGLWINAGHFRNGVVLAPASSRLLADQLLGRQPIIDPTPYQP